MMFRDVGELELDWFRSNQKVTFRAPLAQNAAGWWAATIFDRYNLTPFSTAGILTYNLPETTKSHYENINPQRQMFQLEASLNSDDGYFPIFLSGVNAQFLEEENTLFIELVLVDASYQGAGLGTALMRNIYDMARDLGIQSLGLKASLDAGPWVWLKFGFVPTVEAWEAAKPTIEVKLTNLGRLVTSEEQARVRLLLESDDPNSMRLFLSLERLVPSIPRTNHGLTARNVKLGLSLLVDAGVEWDGILDFNDRLSMSLFYERTGIEQ